MQDYRFSNQMLHAWSGPACVVGTVIALVLIARFIPPPPAYLTADQVAQLYRDHLLPIRIGLFFAIAATSLLIPFSAVISIQMLRKEGNRPVMAFTQLAGGATGSLVLIIAFMVMMMAAFDPSRPVEVTKAMHDAGWLMLLLPYSPFCVQYIAIAMVILQDSSGKPVFPRWVAFFNIWIAITFIPTGLVGFFMTGPITWHGVIGFWIPTISYGTWYIVMFLALKSAIREDQLLDHNTSGSHAA
jgi:hypothetical protein